MSERIIAGPEDLTAAERIHLRRIRDFCDTQPTMARIYLKVWPPVLLTVVAAAIGIATAVWLDDMMLAWLMGAFTLGMLVRDPMHFKGVITFNAVNNAIINRDRLDELLAEPSDDNYS